jgi:hypothetical protein
MTVDDGLSRGDWWSEWDRACELEAMYTVQWDTTLWGEEEVSMLVGMVQRISAGPPGMLRWRADVARCSDCFCQYQCIHTQRGVSEIVLTLGSLWRRQRRRSAIWA